MNVAVGTSYILISTYVVNIIIKTKTERYYTTVKSIRGIGGVCLLQIGNLSKLSTCLKVIFLGQRGIIKCSFVRQIFFCVKNYY